MRKLRFLTAALCAVVLFCGLASSAYAVKVDEDEPAEAVEETTGGLDWEGLDPAELKPLTPAGTGTVIDNTTDGDGKEFFTITTADESVFYLVIDRQRETENVYFLNAVTVNDLLPLATGYAATVTPEPLAEPEPTPTPDPVPVTEPEPQPAETTGGNMTTLVVALAVVLIGGAAGWYFKIYKPKQERAAEVEEDYADETGPDYGDGYGEEYDGEDYEAGAYGGDYDGPDGGGE